MQKAMRERIRDQLKQDISTKKEELISEYQQHKALQATQETLKLKERTLLKEVDSLRAFLAERRKELRKA